MRWKWVVVLFFIVISFFLPFSTCLFLGVISLLPCWSPSYLPYSITFKKGLCLSKVLFSYDMLSFPNIDYKSYSWNEKENMLLIEDSVPAVLRQSVLSPPGVKGSLNSMDLQFQITI